MKALKGMVVLLVGFLLAGCAMEPMSDAQLAYRQQVIHDSVAASTSMNYIQAMQPRNQRIQSNCQVYNYGSYSNVQCN